MPLLGYAARWRQRDAGVVPQNIELGFPALEKLDRWFDGRKILQVQGEVLELTRL